MEKIKKLEEENKKYKDLSEICNDANGFNEAEIKCCGSFESLKDGVVEYTAEFLDKFMGGVGIEELQRKDILFAPNGTLKLMHVAQIPKGAVFGE